MVNQQDESMIDLLEGYSVPLHNLGCFFLETGQVSAAKLAFSKANTHESDMALADLYYQEKNFIECERLWRKVASAESLEKILILKTQYAHLGGIEFFESFDGVESVPVVLPNEPQKDDKLDHLFRTLVVYERQQKQKALNLSNEGKLPQIQVSDSKAPAAPSSPVPTIKENGVPSARQSPRNDGGASEMQELFKEEEMAMQKWHTMLRENGVDWSPIDGGDKPVVSNPRKTRHALHVGKDGEGVRTKNIPENLKKLLIEEGIITNDEVEELGEDPPPPYEVGPSPFSSSSAGAAPTSSSSATSYSNAMTNSISRRTKNIRKSVANFFTPQDLAAEASKEEAREREPSCIKTNFLSPSSSSSSSSDAPHSPKERPRASTAGKLLAKFKPTSDASPNLAGTASYASSSASPAIPVIQPAQPAEPVSNNKKGLLKRITSVKLNKSELLVPDKSKERRRHSMTLTPENVSNSVPPAPSPLASASASAVECSAPMRVTHKAHVGLDTFGNLNYNMPKDLRQIFNAPPSPKKKKK